MSSETRIYRLGYTDVERAVLRRAMATHIDNLKREHDATADRVIGFELKVAKSLLTAIDVQTEVT